MSQCSQADHDALKADAARWRSEILRLRPWPAAGLEIGECPHCGSTLAVELAPVEQAA